MNSKIIIQALFASILSFGCVLLGYESKVAEPLQVYRVYLEGKSLGLIESKQDLENYIDSEQQALKEKYNIDKVYAPTDLDIEQEITYDERINTTQQIYDKIKNITPFTISGYSITIKGIEETNEAGEKVTTEDKVIYVLDQKIFDQAVDNMIASFIDKDQYEKYVNGTQEEIKDVGSQIEDVFIENKIIIRKENISADETIYQNVEDLSKFLMFGTLEEQKKYTVQEGDTISDVAYNNKISNEEFLVANPQFQDENSLLFPGQQVTLGILQPQFDLVEVDHVVELQAIKYTREVRYDNNLLIGTTNVIQSGQDGLARTTRKVKKVNGEITSVATDQSSTEVITPAVNEIVVRGGRANSYADSGYWAWPTKTPYTITSGLGYRWGSYHDAIDIAGTGRGSPIYAANNGVVVEATYRWPDGNYIVINHNNGYYTIYGHLDTFYVQVGQVVSLGQVIGGMGSTGYVTGVHLHFGLWKGGPPYRGGTVLNPLTLY